MEDEIRICSSHRDKEETPLIFTFAFDGAEYWCPYCGANYGIFGAGDMVKNSKKIENRHEKYKKLSKRYLSSKSMMICSCRLINGKERTFDSLPPQTKSYHINMSKSWKYKINN